MHYKKLLELATLAEKSTISRLAKRAHEMEVEQKKRNKLMREALDELLVAFDDILQKKVERKLQKSRPELKLVK
jgi:hypothetical protein